MKEEERTIEQLFNEFRPEIDGGDKFMEQLERRLDAIEYVRQLQQREQKRNRYVMLGAFGGGLAVGSILCAMLIIPSDTIPSITMDTHFLMLRLIGENFYMFTCAIIVIIAIAGITVAIGMYQEMSGFMEGKRLYRILNEPSAQESHI